MPSLMDKLKSMNTSTIKTSIDNPSNKNAQCLHKFFSYDILSVTSLKTINTQILNEVFRTDYQGKLSKEDFIFIDTETTGLSGGVGTIAFQIGIGYISKDKFIVEQFFIEDYDAEIIMLEKLSKILSGFPVVVTYNGKSFDIPLIINRFVMNRLSTSTIPKAHADVVHAARRVWKKRIGLCSLKKVENEILGIFREDDLPGSKVPKTYFAYLSNRDFIPIEKILEHNKQDILSLAQLFFYLYKMYNNPDSSLDSLDLLSIANSFKKISNEKAKKFYRLSTKGNSRALAYGELALLEKRQGNFEVVIKLYKTMLSRGDNVTAACTGLAKIYEHQKKDYNQALLYTRQALLNISQPSLNNSSTVQETINKLKYRYVRLCNKLKKQEVLNESSRNDESKKGCPTNI